MKGGDKLNVKLLKSKMVLYGDEDFVTAISKLLEIARQTASAKLHGKSDFTQTEIAIISRRYSLSADDIQKIFIDESDENKNSSMIGYIQ